MKYRLGLDIGITSVGWAVLQHNDDEEPFCIADLGVRTFKAAENAKDGSSLALPRREARSSRRRLRRHRHRLDRIKLLLQDINLISIPELDALYHNSKELTDIYELRQAGLDRLLKTEEWSRVLIHLAQRRGFKSNRKNAASGKRDKKEEGKILAAVNENNNLMAEKPYRTVGEMLFLDEKFSLHKRNKAAQYNHTIGRDKIAEEIALLFNAQRRYSNPYSSESFEKKYKEIVLSQRSFDEGPGLPSPYAGNMIEKMIGKCTFEKEQFRAPKAAYSFQLFNLLQKINSLQIENIAGVSRKLNKEERKKLLELAHKKSDLRYSDLRKLLDLSSDESFNSLTYNQADVGEIEKKSKFNYLIAFHAMRIALDKVAKGRISQLTVEQIDSIGETITLFRNEATIGDRLNTAGLTSCDIEALSDLSFRGFGHLSLVAIKKIIPHLQEGLVYSEAATLAGYNFRAHDNEDKSVYLPANGVELQDITNPVVRRAISQTIKVINAIIRKYGSPQLLCIELSREMSKNFDDRKKIEKQHLENRGLNDAIKNKIIEYGHANPTGQDIVKMKLWQEQDGRCAYSGEAISISNLFEPGIADVDHIIPYSVSFDDGYSNKVLVKSNENRQKGNLLPCEYLKGDPARLERFIVWVNTSVWNYRKKQKLLKQSITAEDRNKWKNRQLNDTKYISRFMLNYIRDNLQFAPAKYLGKRKVVSVNGGITAYLRKRWGLQKNRLAGDLHHAMDAVVVACVSEGMIRKITRYSQYCEARFARGRIVDYETGEVINPLEERFGVRFIEPWENFKLEVESRLSDNPAIRICNYNLDNYLHPENVQPVFVSRMPQRKNSGPAHEDTVRSGRLLAEGFIVSKVEITKLKLDADGEIMGYYNPSSDPKLYNALKKRLHDFNGVATEAFKEKFYKPASPGKPASVVKKVKTIKASTLNVMVNKGVAANGDMIRIDVFKKTDGYYWVPIYVSDMVKPDLPNKAVVAAKPVDLWVAMKDEDFIFSLYPNDLIRFVHKRGVYATRWDKTKFILKESFMYYISADISNGSISVKSHDSSYSLEKLGVKTLALIEKWNVDVLGGRVLVKKETRQYFPGQLR